ncbi:hypothetical protein RI103_37375 (plasmid) [Paraburkholderia sp. FT54]|uniref:hypothetical protein n=1 Tax=Paraburkholderia sp. FT54 TaxID=3074437 RepID=UPI0028776E89|nr:hypothetical protein [Paraburkholderia sp. FT54]WNC95406.1 hypothetical protein RI103_37375 [Paraburkholderia sp. FT54]
MQRTLKYRGFQICVDLVPTSEDMFDAWLCIEGPPHVTGVTTPGQRIKVRGGPFSQRWAYFVAQIAGLASIDVILDPSE